MVKELSAAANAAKYRKEKISVLAEADRSLDL